MADRTEISFEVTPEETAVLDGYCSAKGIKRTSVVRQLLKDWSAEQLHVAEIVMRVAGTKKQRIGVSNE